MSKPTVVGVPGAWHGPDVYDKVFDILAKHGYPTVGLSLPSVGAKPPHTSFDGDVKAIRDSLRKLVIDQGRDVILITHSYSGMPGVEAPVGLSKDERLAEGKEGGVIRLVFIMSFAMPEGFQPTAGGAKYPEWMKMDLEVSLLWSPLTYYLTLCRMVLQRCPSKMQKRSSTTIFLPRKRTCGLPNSIIRALECTLVQHLMQPGGTYLQPTSLQKRTGRQ